MTLANPRLSHQHNQNTHPPLRQEKYNLLREESEGYARLLVALHGSGGNGGGDAADCDRADEWPGLVALVGSFNLDPNRVCDLVLDAAEIHGPGHADDVAEDGGDAAMAVDTDAAMAVDDDAAARRPAVGRRWHALLTRFTSTTLGQTLGFKLQQAAEGAGQANAPATGPLCALASRLVADGLVRLELLCAHASPDDTAVVLARLVDLSSPAAACDAAARARALDASERLFDRLGRSVVAHSEVSLALRSKLHVIMGSSRDRGSIYARVSPSFSAAAPGSSTSTTSTASTTSTTADAEAGDIGTLDALMPTLRRLGPHLGGDNFLITKLCRVLGPIVAAFAAAHTAGAADPTKDSRPFPELPPGLVFALAHVLLPGLGTTRPSPPLSAAVAAVLRPLPPTTRHPLLALSDATLGGTFHGAHAPKSGAGAVSSTDTLVAHRKVSEANLRRSLRRLSSENARPLGRMLAKPSHAHPVACARVLAGQLQAYDNLIYPAVDALRYTGALALDALFGVVVGCLENGRVGDDGIMPFFYFYFVKTLKLIYFLKKIYKPSPRTTPPPRNRNLGPARIPGPGAPGCLRATALAEMPRARCCARTGRPPRRGSPTSRALPAASRAGTPAAAGWNPCSGSSSAAWPVCRVPERPRLKVCGVIVLFDFEKKKKKKNTMFF
jgi:THO complex subunit 2